jgi:hypothetical protein
VVAADVNGDGYANLLVYGSQSVKVLLNLGNGSFTAPVVYPVRAFSYNMALADVNADGYPDVVVPGGAGYAAQVLPGQGDGTFGSPIDYPLAGTYNYVAVADVNGDGRPDLAAGMSSPMTVAILLGQASGFTLEGSYSFSDPAGFGLRSLALADADGDTYPDLLAGWTASNDAAIRFNARPRITAFTPTSGTAGTMVIITGTHLSGTTAVSVGGTAVSSFIVDSETRITAVVGSGSTGVVQVTNAAGTASSGTFTVPSPLTISSGTLTNPTLVPAGTYSSLTITGTGVAQLTGAVQVTTSVSVQAGGVLLTNCQPLTGAGGFTLAAGATLGICDLAGLSSTPGTGAVQLGEPVSLSAAATYLYNGSAAQVTGTGLPATISALTTTNPAPLTLSQSLTVTQLPTVGSAGNLNLNGQSLVLASTATGTAW